jgi:translation initiation factor IF-3
MSMIMNLNEKMLKNSLKEGAKLKAFVFFKGRSIIYKEQGQILLLRLAQDLEEFGKVEAMPVLEGKRMIMYIAPKKKKKVISFRNFSKRDCCN